MDQQPFENDEAQLRVIAEYNMNEAKGTPASPEEMVTSL